jgi:hypothetical protein
LAATDRIAVVREMPAMPPDCRNIARSPAIAEICSLARCMEALLLDGAAAPMPNPATPAVIESHSSADIPPGGGTASRPVPTAMSV